MNYCIKDGYKTQFPSLYEENEGNEMQQGAYSMAELLSDVGDYNVIIDFGCGKGWKLRKLVGDRVIYGIDTDINIQYCKRTYPQGTWIVHNLDEPFSLSLPATGVIICADVLEHLYRPEWLLSTVSEYIAKGGVAIFSTPERDLVRGEQCMGPPTNRHHAREWNMKEFLALLELFGINVRYHGLIQGDPNEQSYRTILVVASRITSDASPLTTNSSFCGDSNG